MTPLSKEEPLSEEERQPPAAPESGARWRSPTLDAATLDARDGDHFVVVLPDGERVTAELAAGVSAELANECLRTGRMVLVRMIGEVPQVLGALQTQPSPIVSRDGVVTVSGRELRLEAEQQLHLETGATRVSVDRRGKLSIVGERLTMQVASLIKLIASKVELP